MMIRKFDDDETIIISKKYVDESSISFLWYWFFSLEAIKSDIDWILEHEHNQLPVIDFLLVKCYFIFLMPLIAFSAIFIWFITLGNRMDPREELIKASRVLLIIISLIIIIPFSIVTFPDRLIKYLKFRRNALIHLLSVDYD